jgi:hypothetical protein
MLSNVPTGMYFALKYFYLALLPYFSAKMTLIYSDSGGLLSFWEMT